MFGPGWISGAIVDEAETPYTSLDVFGSLRQVGTPDGDVVGFTARDGVNFDPEVGQETLKLTYASATDTYKLTDDQGSIVTFGRVTGSAARQVLPDGDHAAGQQPEHDVHLGAGDRRWCRGGPADASSRASAGRSQLRDAVPWLPRPELHLRDHHDCDHLHPG